METQFQKLATGVFASLGQLAWNRFTGPGRVGLQSMYIHFATAEQKSRALRLGVPRFGQIEFALEPAHHFVVNSVLIAQVKHRGALDGAHLLRKLAP